MKKILLSLFLSAFFYSAFAQIKKEPEFYGLFLKVGQQQIR
jgi:hypothetical protein